MSGLAGTRPAWGSVMAAARRGDLPLVHLGATPQSVARAASGLAYLATPYSRIARDADGAWDYAASYRAMMAARAAWIELTELRVTAVSPIAVSADHCHAGFALDPLDQEFWTRWCAPFLDAARAVVVPDIAGWDDSDGVWHEVRAALACNKQVHVYAEV